MSILNPGSVPAGSNLITRRWFLEECGIGLGSMALGPLLGTAGLAASSPGQAGPFAPKAPHYAPKAKNVIYLFMAGAPSHLELFDYKPRLAEFDGTLPPAELLEGYRAAFISPNSKLLGPKFKFARQGRCGAEISEVLPHLAKVVDDIAIVKSMSTDAFNHAPGQILMTTGSQQFGRPSLGAWATYGLGSESQDLPAFVVFSSGKKGQVAVILAGAVASFPPSTRESCSAALANRCCTSPIPGALTLTCSETLSTRSKV